MKPPDKVQTEADITTSGSAGVAAAVAREVGCVVVAMRYPVSDEFAIALADELYQGLFALDLPVAAALARAVPAAGSRVMGWGTCSSCPPPLPGSATSRSATPSPRG